MGECTPEVDCAQVHIDSVEPLVFEIPLRRLEERGILYNNNKSKLLNNEARTEQIRTERDLMINKFLTSFDRP